MPKKKPNACYEVTKQVLKTVEDMAAKGYYNTEIARKLDWSIDKFYKVVRSNNDFKDALKRGNEKDIRVTLNAKAKKIRGYKYKEVTKEWDPKLKKMIVTKEVIKHHAPSDTMIIFDLVNKDPKNYKHKQEQVHSGTIIIKTDKDDDKL